jgi:ELWxxDGT repeat protein
MTRTRSRKGPSRKPALEYLEDRLAPSVNLVKDIYSYTTGSYPRDLTDLNGTLFFTAVDNTNTRQLYKTDGSAGGTAQLTFGTRLSGLSNLFNVGGKLLFSVFDNQLGNNVFWNSDGTVAGTHPFLVSGDAVSVHNTSGTNYALMGGKLYFEGYDTGNSKYDLWVTDGTSAGTHAVQPATTTGPTGNNLVNFVAAGTTLFFQYYDGTNYQLWKSNGTASGTVQVAELTSNQPSNYTAVGNTLFFEMYDSTPALYALWTSDGTTTAKVADIGSTKNQFSSLIAFSGKLWFQVNDTTDAPNTGWALWSSDGTAGNTGAFKFNGGTTAVQLNPVSQMIGLGSNLYFQGFDATHSYSLWKTDGVSSHNSTATVQSSGASPFNGSPVDLGVVGTELFFRANDSSNGRSDLWKTDGSSAGTMPVQTGSLVAQGVADGSGIVGSNGKAFFAAYDVDANNQSPHSYELWVSDGSAANTAMIIDINTTTNSSNPHNLTAVGSEMFFLAYDNTGLTALYQSDGTAANTVPVQTSANVIPTNPNYLTAAGNTLFFTANGPDGNELWTSGTATDSAVPFQHGGSQQIASSPFDLVNNNGVVYFFAFDNAHSEYALWKSDGTQPNTVPVADLPSGTNLGQLTLAGSNLFFQVYDSAHSSYALWKYNGTAASQVADISAGQFSNTTAVGSSVFFQALDSGDGLNALWSSDGTTTTQLTHFANGGLDGQIAFAGKLFYSAYNPASNGTSLWMSDGTAPGTQLYLTAAGNPVAMPGGNPYFTLMGGNLYFQNVDIAQHSLLAKTDGTPGGYATVQAGGLGTVAYSPSYIVNDNGLLVFEASDNTGDGWQLWQSDGTASGTLLTAVIYPGNSSYPQNLGVAGSQVFFSATDAYHGFELWGATFGATVVTAGLSGPTDGVSMQHRDFVLTASDSNSGNNAAGFSFAINWGDGTTETLIGQSGLTVDHQYGTPGNFIISVTATNIADNVSSGAVTQAENITATEVQGVNLALGGLAGNDAFVITKGTKANTYTVKVNSTTLISNFTPATGEEVLLYGGNGTNTYSINDTGTTADTFTLGTGYVTFLKATFVPQSPGPWTINGDNGKDTYTIVGAANASLVGGSGINTYNISTGGSLSGTLNGGSGTQNTLSYSKYTTSGVVVDLPLASATAIDSGANGGISGIRNVTGSQNGGDILVGDANPNVLKANKGHNILIGGSGGGDTLTSGGADILIAGTTNYDSNIGALLTILATWKTSTTSTYASVISTIMGSSFADPLNSSTVTDSSGSDTADTLNGSTKPTTDWFFAHNTGGAKPNDTLNGVGSGDTVSSI